MYDIVKNVLTQKERGLFIEKLKPFIPGDVPNCPIFQTSHNLCDDMGFQTFATKIGLGVLFKLPENNIRMSWMEGRWSNSKETQMNWMFDDNLLYTSVYFLKVPFFKKNGVLFKEGFVKAPQNSVVVFRGSSQYIIPQSNREEYVIVSHFVSN
tara:strand:+ start:778 stop:1236 length:459 start_codon:yes stop_codon:yes gene_type:complete